MSRDFIYELKGEGELILEMLTPPTKQFYMFFETFDPSGATFRLRYPGGVVLEDGLTPEQVQWSVPPFDKFGVFKVTWTYKGVSTASQVQTSNVGFEALLVTQYPKLNYAYGESLDLSGMEVSAVINDSGHVFFVPVYNWTTDYPDGYKLNIAADTLMITVSVSNGFVGGTVQDTFNINIEKTMTGIKVDTLPRTVYAPGSTISYENLIIREVFNNGIEGAAIPYFDIEPPEGTLLSEVGSFNVVVTANGFSTSFGVEVNEELPVFTATVNFLDLVPYGYGGDSDYYVYAYEGMRSWPATIDVSKRYINDRNRYWMPDHTPVITDLIEPETYIQGPVDIQCSNKAISAGFFNNHVNYEHYIQIGPETIRLVCDYKPLAYVKKLLVWGQDAKMETPSTKSRVWWNLTDMRLVGVSEVGRLCFHGAPRLKNVKADDLLVVDGFRDCTNLQTFDAINLRRIRQSAFWNCTSLQSIDFPRVSDIELTAFYQCTSLESANLPELETAGALVFQDCTSLRSVRMDNTLAVPLQGFQGCSSLTDVYTPKATLVKHAAFLYCGALTTIDLPKVTRIEEIAFYDCTSLTTVILRANSVCELYEMSGGEEKINEHTFYHTPVENGTGYIYVPDNLVDSYKNSVYWTQYASQIKGISEL